MENEFAEVVRLRDVWIRQRACGILRKLFARGDEGRPERRVDPILSRHAGSPMPILCRLAFAAAVLAGLASAAAASAAPPRPCPAHRPPPPPSCAV